MVAERQITPEQARQLRHELDGKLFRSPAPDQTPDAHEESVGEELQRRLLEARVLSEIKPPITVVTPYQNRKAVPIQGEPLSETVIRERR